MTRSSRAAADPEQIRMLATDASKAYVHQQSYLVLGHMPEWAKYEAPGLIPPGSANVLKNLHGLSLEKQSELISTDPDLIHVLFEAMKIESDAHPVQYILTLLYDIVRDDTSRYDVILRCADEADISARCLAILEMHKTEASVADKAAFLLSGFLCRDQRQTYAHRMGYIIEGLSLGTFMCSDVGRLEGLGNLLKRSALRPAVWDAKGTVEFIGNHLRADCPEIYPAVFCVWLFSLDRDYTSKFIESGILKKICKVLNDCKTEKVVRLCARIVMGVVHDDAALEVLIDQDAAHALTLLEYAKWRDDEVYTEIHDSLANLQARIRQFSNFDRYCRELQKGKLRWSFLHTEKFWHENVMHFEDNEFAAIKTLAGLLRSRDPVTQSVACSDLGEFARLHPTGKKIIAKHKIKEMVMMLMNSKNREVQREALLCVQKMMIERWQDAVTT